MSHIITSTPDPFCSCGSTTMDGVPGEGWVCSQCGAAIPAERVRHAFNPGPPVGNITVAAPPTEWWIHNDDWNRLPRVTRGGQYVFRDPKPTGLARKLGRRRKR